MRPSWIPIAVFFFLLAAPSAFAWDVLVVQKYHARPYAEVVRGFRDATNAGVAELILSEATGEDSIREIRRRAPDLILAVGIDALVRVKKIRDIPIIYCMVLNPDSVLGDQDNITGISMNIAPEKQLGVLLKALPTLKKIGLVYNPRQTGSIVARAHAAAEKAGIRLVALKAEQAKDLPRQLERLPRDLDLYWMLPDSTFTTPEAVESLFLFSIRSRIPVLTFSDRYLRMGALISLGLDTTGMGKQAGEMAEKIRAGAKAGGIPRADAERLIPIINRAVAANLGILPEGKSLKTFRIPDGERP
jgi:putative tryptophan/tyrosine transport system substrate-binding protein